MSPTKKILIGLGVSLVLIVALAAVFGGGEEGVEVDTAEARVRPITQSVTASGIVAAETEVSISPEVSGEVVFVGVTEGERVERGQLLLRIRPDVYAAQRQQALAGVRGSLLIKSTLPVQPAVPVLAQQQLVLLIHPAHRRQSCAQDALERHQQQN